MTLQTQIDQQWNKFYEEAGWTADPRSNFREIRDKFDAMAASAAEENYERWLSILDLGVEWLSYVHLALCADGDAVPRNEESRAIWALTGAATNFVCAIRDACIAGHETPAKAMLRTLTETLYLCLALLYDKKLALQYVNAQDDKDVKDFWHSEASPKNLHLKIIAIEKQIGFDDEVIELFTKHRMGDYQVMSQASHLAYGLACSTCLPEPIERRGSVAVGIWGRASEESAVSLSRTARTIWYFSRLSYQKLIADSEDHDALLFFSADDENHRAIVCGREVYSHVVLENWNEKL